MKKSYKYYILLFIGIFLFGCEPDKEVKLVERSPSTTSQLIYSRANLSMLNQALIRTGLDLTLNQGTYTVFAPTNDVFASYINNLGFASIAEVPVDALTEILTYHVLSGEFPASALASGSQLAVSGDRLFFTSIGNRRIINGRFEVVTGNVAGTNGIIHIINGVLTAPSGDLEETINDLSDDYNLSTFVAALNHAGDNLDLSGLNLTVLAPTNAAFAAYGLNAGNIAGAFSSEVMAEILSFHVLPSVKFSTDFTATRLYTLAGPKDVAQGVDVAINPVRVETAAVEVANLIASNGVIHVMSDLVLPKATNWERLNRDVATLGTNDGTVFNYFRSLMVGSGFDFQEVFDNETVYTVLIPSTGVDVATLTPEQLKDLADAHTFQGRITLNAAANGSKITSVNGKEYFVGFVPGSGAAGIGPWINGRNRTVQFSDGVSLLLNRNTYNGHLTSMSGSLVPLPADSLSVVATTNPDITLFAAALKKVKLLSNSVNYTIFAPRNDVFTAALPTGAKTIEQIEALNPEIEAQATLINTVRTLVSHHIVASVKFKNEIDAARPTYTALSGREIRFVLNGSTVQILRFSTANAAIFTSIVPNVTEPGPPVVITQRNLDILARNGVIHVVDRVL
jgi:transforming growth factor-beta-induced protein